jgi:hypothetical protein
MYQVIRYRHSVRLQATLLLTNPNLGLASRMGLVNPLSIAWEVVPFSFVVDWFLPVGNFLENLTSLAGTVQLEAQAAYRKTASGSDRVAFPDIPGLDIGKNRKDLAYSFQRAVGELPMPKLAFKILEGPSVVRAATAISLLITVLNTGLKRTYVGRGG